jgi:hypothetical protein
MFSGLPSRVPFGREQVFSTDYDSLDWSVVGRVAYGMADARTGKPFFEDTGGELVDLFVQLNIGDAPVVVSARFTQERETESIDAATGAPVFGTVTCTQTISRTVTGFRHFLLADCDKLRYRPRNLVIACGDGNFQLRRLHWRSWNRASVRGTARAMLNDCIPYCARGRFHSIRARVKAYRLRVCRRGNGAEGYHYTRLRITYAHPLSRKSFPWAGPRARRGYTYNSTCFSYGA